VKYLVRGGGSGSSQGTTLDLGGRGLFVRRRRRREASVRVGGKRAARGSGVRGKLDVSARRQHGGLGARSQRGASLLRRLTLSDGDL
jgi:hypothetical protein